MRSVRLRRWTALAVPALVIAAACTRTSTIRTVAPTGPASDRTPVVLVHGYQEQTGLWKDVGPALVAAGYLPGDITNVDYDSTKSAAVAAAVLAAEVDRALDYAHAHGNPRAARVDVVSHSYGAMVTRHCIELGGCAGKVDHWMSLAGADNGTEWFALTRSNDAGNDLVPGSAETRRLADGWRDLVAQGVKVEVQWTPNDLAIVPARLSLAPAPAVNKQISPLLNHWSMMSDRAVIAETIAFLADTTARR